MPRTLYKYQPINRFSLSKLINNQIWFSKPNSLNDPFDCQIVLRDNTNEIDYQEILKAMLEDSSDPDSLHSEAIAEDGSITYDFKQKVERGYRAGAQDTIEKMRDERGVASLSAIHDDILMWSYYADGHKGICLEFDTSYSSFRYARPVEYRDEIPSVNIADAVVRSIDGIFWPMILTKFTGWSHEKEWRFFHQEGDRLYYYPARALTGVYMGWKMPRNEQLTIGRILQDSHATLYRTVRSENNYDLQVEKIVERTEHL